MKKLTLLETATQYSSARNKYGDILLSPTGTIQCLYRDMSSLSRVPGREEVSVEGIFWFDPTATVKMGDVVGYLGKLYRIEKVTVAKMLVTSNQSHFIKCHASLYRAIS